MGGMTPSFLRMPSRRIRPAFLGEGDDPYGGGPILAPAYDEAGPAPVTASPRPLAPRFEPSTGPVPGYSPITAPDIPGGLAIPRRPNVSVDLKGYPHDIGAPIGPARDLGALPAGYADPSGAIGIDPGINPHPLDTYDQIGVAHAGRLDPRAAAEQELGPERKLGGWGKALQIAMGALAGMTGQQVPEELTPYGRHRIYQGELGRREAEISDRYKSEDERLLEPERARLARNQAEMSNLQLEQARAQIDYTNRRNRGELTPDQIFDNRRQVLQMGAPVTEQDAKLLNLPPDWIGKPLPPYRPQGQHVDPTRIIKSRNPDGSESVGTLGDDGKLHPVEWANGGYVTSSAAPRRDPTARPRAQAAFVSQFGTSDEGKSVYQKAYSDALAGAIDP